MKKRTTAAIIIVSSAVFLSACGKRNDVINYIPENQAPADFSSVVTVISTPVPETPSPAVTPETPAPTPTPAPVNTPVVVNINPAGSGNSATNNNVSKPGSGNYSETGYVTITKSPTGETVDEGGNASFIAYANNASSTVWIIVSPDAKESYNVNDGPLHFDGLRVKGQGTSTLVLENIPLAMDGWRIQCYFTGVGGPEYTSGAYLKVLKVDPNERRARELASNCQIETYKLASGYGYGKASAVRGFSYYVNERFASFNVECTNDVYNIVFEFKSYPDAKIYRPISATVRKLDDNTIVIDSKSFSDTDDLNAVNQYLAQHFHS